MGNMPKDFKPPREKQHSQDGFQENRRKPNSYDRAGIVSKLYCLFVLPFLYANYRKDFDLKAFDECSKCDDCVSLGERLKKKWNQELARQKDGKSISLVRALFRTFGVRYFFLNLASFTVYGVIRVILPQILGRIIRYSNLYFEEEVQLELSLANSSSSSFERQIDHYASLNRVLQLTNRQNVILYSVILSAAVLVNILFSHAFFAVKYRFGMQIRAGLTRLIYEKALRVTSPAVQRFTVGKIVNLISNDINRFDVCLVYVEFSYLAIVETGVAMAILYVYFGRASLGTLAIIALYIPFQSIMANILSRFRSSSILLTDDRLRLMAEILPAMRVIKMYVWEKPFSALVHAARKLEIAKIRYSMMLKCINMALFFVSSKVMAFVCIILFLLDGGELNAEIVFVSMSLFSMVREVMTYQFPLGVSIGVETYISIKRISKFLLEDEISSVDKQSSEISSDLATLNEPNKISLRNVTCHSELDGTTILNDISFEVVPGKLTVIIGPVGSGKSSILLSILNELPITGQINIHGKAVYVSQEAWIFNGTVRENILFGRDFDPARYKQVVSAATLAADFKQFASGDSTMVADRGTSLSGGQKARISLARALYTDADCFLLDDPLSAVDASVAKHLFDYCIKEYLKEKCVLLVTHQLQFIKAADQIVVLKSGSMLAVGSYLELLKEGIDVFKYSTTTEKQQQPIAAQSNQPDVVPGTSSDQYQQPKSPSISSGSFRFRPDSLTSDASYCVTSRAASFVESDIDSNYDQLSIQFDISKNQTMDQEISPPNQSNLEASNHPSGDSKKSTLKTLVTYVRSGAGPLLFVTFVVSNFVTQIFFTGTDYWLSAWTDYQEKLYIQSLNPNYTFDRNPIISSSQNENNLIYSLIILLLFISAIVRTVSYFVICMRSSVNLHNQIFNSLIQAPIAFFDRTPIGIIMNRVSRDLGIIDDLLPPTGFEALEILGNCIGIFVLCTAFNYFIAFPFVILVVFIVLGTKFYVSTARNVKRQEGIARSPLFNQMASTLSGLATIRSYGVQRMFIDRFSETQNVHTSTVFTFLCCSRLFGVYLELLCFVYIFSLIVYMNIQLDYYTGSIIGLTISQSLMLTDSFNWGVRQYCEVENYMTSVERIVEFGRLDKEALDTCECEPPENWPQSGSIHFEEVSLCYNQDQSNEICTKYVLKDLTFSIKGGEKIGIVGRTGAGKSSLITALFRLTQPASGSICIDGIDTGEISLSRLRKCLSIIPQEPILFSGNIRRNLDPFNEKSDRELWDAVDKVQLKAKIQSFPAQLDSPVTECGNDFSVGQKQLVCLARAILRKNRILILDEATANVDPRTDSLIQQTIRTEFADCTVLTIAHRLNTIIDYDRVIVLDAGTLAQFDSPHNLIEQEKGIFFELYDNLNQDVKNELLKQIADGKQRKTV